MTPNGVPGLLVDLIGYLTGAALYAMIVVMVARERSAEGQPFLSVRGRLPLLTGVAGLVWNLGELLTPGGQLIGLPAASPIAIGVAFAALGSLPAAVVHSLLQGHETAAGKRVTRIAVPAAYAVSGTAAALHIFAALSGGAVPSRPALWILTGGFVSLMAMLLFLTRAQPLGRRGVWVAALSIFAVSAIHFGRHGGNESWWVELIGHHASLPLALAILLQDYRFAFADLFLKNAIALLMLVATSVAVFFGAVVPFLRWQHIVDLTDARAIAVLVAVWLAGAMAASPTRRLAAHLVDRLVLRRPDYDAMLADTARAINAAESEAGALDAMASAMRTSFGLIDVRVIPDATAEADRRTVLTGSGLRSLGYDAGRAAVVRLRTVEAPRCALAIGPLSGGRSLLSDDVHLLEAMARLGSRRLDAIRVAEERVSRDVREQRMQRLASEAELRALRAQINPHFLFNALTTIGYLIQAAPTRALETLLRLTSVLRGVLHRSDVEFSTLGEEIELIHAYLEIERARFEERLRVDLSVPAELHGLRVPTLLLQPLVENAVKHGIGQLTAGGTVTVRASVTSGVLTVTVTDTGAGFDVNGSTRRGVGLASVEQRVRAHFGDAGSLVITSQPGAGTTATVRLPSATIASDQRESA